MKDTLPYYVLSALRRVPEPYQEAYRRAGRVMGGLDSDYEYATILTATGYNPKYAYRVPRRIRKIVDVAREATCTAAIAQDPLSSLIWQTIWAAEATTAGIPSVVATQKRHQFEQLTLLTKIYYGGFSE